ncbi:MAG: carboxypeptidase regulatory-like domain-containing protein, partial [Anaerolineae bacterium]|nr:carboxypeptidase regulatory-like domain-containing protein [Anaerolineae bacterium]
INGVEVINGSAFGSDSVSVLLSSPAFAPLPAFQWLTSLREDTASVTEDGTAVTVSYVGAVEGTTELICTADAISATGTLIESVPVTGATIEVVGNGTITGIVTLEEATNHTGIVVILTDENGTPVTTATTAADGAFSFTVEPGSYFVRADADGYVTVASEPIVVVGGTTEDMGTAVLAAGDVNADDVVDLLDITDFAARYNDAVTNATDFDRSGAHDLLDFTALVDNLDLVGPTNWTN